MKSILLSIKPEWVEKILNGKKTIEIRKKFPKDYVGWVYIYCTKGEIYLRDKKNCFGDYHCFPKEVINATYLNGKVVARFWCDGVGETFFQQEESFSNEMEKTLKGSCLTYDELWDYAENDTFYKIRISKLEVFDRPRGLCEFDLYVNGGHLCRDCLFVKQGNKCDTYHCNSLTKAPQNYCYIESGE